MKIDLEKLKKEFNLENVDNSWKKFFWALSKIKRLEGLLLNIFNEYKKFKVFPEKKNVFRVFFNCPLNHIKIVVIGQDPYYSLGLANGLAFATSQKKIIPKSLENIFIEISNDLKIFEKSEIKELDCSLDKWTTQGIFLINSSLTVIENKPRSHSIIWKEFTELLFKYIRKQNNEVIWLIMGKEGKKFSHLLPKNNVLEVTHPSPMSANKGFFDSKIFSKLNKKILEKSWCQINWHPGKK